MSLVAISTLFFKLLDSVEKGRSYEKILKKFNRDRKIHGTSENKLDEGDWITTHNASRDTGRRSRGQRQTWTGKGAKGATADGQYDKEYDKNSRRAYLFDLELVIFHF